jgi:hypothetical protein
VLYGQREGGECGGHGCAILMSIWDGDICLHGMAFRIEIDTASMG